MNSVDRDILKIAIPSIVTNITVPLLGLVDLTIVGHIGNAAYLGAIAVGSMIFNVMYWLFGFLRMGTSGMTSQALGRRDMPLVVLLIGRALFMALVIALLLIIGQKLVLWLSLYLISPDASVSVFAKKYFSICIWGAPAMLSLYCLTGWFIGMQNTRIPLFVSIFQNAVNILVSLTLVIGFGMKIEGVAIGTLTAQYAGVGLSLFIGIKSYGRLLKYFSFINFFDKKELYGFFNVNKDIFIRTLFLVSVNFFFLSIGARNGTVVLAANTLLMTFYTLFSYIEDGFAYAGEALCGKSYGAKNRALFTVTVKHLFIWGGAMALFFTISYMLGGKGILQLFTNQPAVVDEAVKYMPWAMFIPLVSVSAFILDGIFIGTTATRGMLISSVLSSLLFFLTYYLSDGLMGNHGLWMAFLIYLLTRGAIQFVLFPKYVKWTN